MIRFPGALNPCLAGLQLYRGMLFIYNSYDIITLYFIIASFVSIFIIKLNNYCAKVRNNFEGTSVKQWRVISKI